LTGVPLREVGVRWHEVGGSKLDVVWDSIRVARDLLVIRGNHLTGRWKSPEKIDVRIKEQDEVENKKEK
jgi:dolichyl-phosphate beta-glucosyltransferase